MICPHCGAENRDKARFCAHCGKQLTEVQESSEELEQKIETKSQTQLCPNPKCGADNPLSAITCPQCGEPQRQLLGRGTILQGRYQIQSLRGCGGFGAVYRATDLQTGQTVAIKENHQYRTFARFEREGKLLMKLSHPNLPKVHEVFIDQVTGRAYLVMDFIDGETLQEMVERVGRLSWKDAEPIFAQVVEALTYLHGQNIVHRDVKPSNIIVAKRLETVYVKVPDWEEVTVPPPNLSEKIIASETDGKRFESGMNYWQDGWRLEELQRSGWTLSGKCWGDVDAVGRIRRYNLLVTLTDNGIGARNCECSDFRGRRLCKHLVALLLAWVHEPQRFKIVSEKKERRPIERLSPTQVQRQHVILVDFGVAKVMETIDPNRPRSSSIVAWTDGYSPPEQYQSGVEIDARADQYALAATMVFALTGQVPEDAPTRMARFRNGEPTLPPKPADVPDVVWKAIEVAMSFRTEQRFESVANFWGAVPAVMTMVRDWSLVKTIEGHTDYVHSVAFSPDGSLLASGSGDRTIKIWRVRDWSLVKTIEGHADYVRSVAFSPDGSLLASGSGDRTIKIWRVRDWSLVKTIEGHTSWVNSVTFSPDDNFLASGSHDKTVKIWREVKV